MTRTLFFEITDRCNHACFYCCKSFRGQPGITMNSGALDKVLSLPASGLVISGGEPSLAKESVAYVLERATVPVAINTDARRDNPASSGMITSTKTELQIPQ